MQVCRTPQNWVSSPGYTERPLTASSRSLGYARLALHRSTGRPNFLHLLPPRASSTLRSRSRKVRSGQAIPPLCGLHVQHAPPVQAAAARAMRLPVILGRWPWGAVVCGLTGRRQPCMFKTQYNMRHGHLDPSISFVRGAARSGRVPARLACVPNRVLESVS